MFVFWLKLFAVFKILMILYRTMLYINNQGCVNTLQYECDEFYRIHGQDSRNQTSPSRFPCYYSTGKKKYTLKVNNVYFCR